MYERRRLLSAALVVAVSAIGACTSHSNGGQHTETLTYERVYKGFCDDLKFDVFVERFGELLPLEIYEDEGTGAIPTHKCSALTFGKFDGHGQRQEPGAAINVSVTVFDSEQAARDGYSRVVELPRSPASPHVYELPVDQSNWVHTGTTSMLVQIHDDNMLMYVTVSSVGNTGVVEAVAEQLQSFIIDALERLRKTQLSTPIVRRVVASAVGCTGQSWPAYAACLGH